jgi:tungstate transport system ATP-binding protein
MIYQLEGVEHSYGGRTVVDVPSLEIRRGEVLCIVGPSGAGKSTLLRLLNFLETPTRGVLQYDGKRQGVDVSLAVRRQVTTVFQHPMLLRRSVAANVRIGPRLRNANPPDAEVDRWLDRMGLREYAAVPARTLSAGEAQRLALARALIVDPMVLLLDEPTGSLDPYNVGLIEGIIQADNTERHTTTIIVTHDIFQARRLADRTALMIGGSIVEVGETEPFFTNPQHEKTAAFLRGELVF